MKIALIVNPVSRGRNRMISRVEAALSGRGIGYDLHVSQFDGHLWDIGAKIDAGRYDALVSMGGDGTNFQFLNGLLSAGPAERLPPLGIIPAGSGNSFVRDLGIFSVDQGIEAILRNAPKPVDVCSFTQGEKTCYFVNLMGLGFVTDVAGVAAQYKRWGDLSYQVGVFRCTLDLRCHHMELTADGRTFSGPNCFVEFCNSRYTGGNMLMAPQAAIDDGMMDIVIAGPMSRARLLAALPRIYSGRHIEMKEVTCIRAKTASIETHPPKALLPDGELVGISPVRVEVHPGMVRYLG